MSPVRHLLFQAPEKATGFVREMFWSFVSALMVQTHVKKESKNEVRADGLVA